MDKIKQLFLLALSTLTLYSAAAVYEKTVFAEWDKPSINVFYVLPQEVNDQTEILFIIHGNSRNADGYIEVWANHAKDKNIILIAPEFSKSKFSNYNTLQMSSSTGKILKNRDLYLNNSIDIMFSHYKNLFRVKTDLYKIYGHSGGAQFVHRYLLMSDEPKVKTAVAANAGWYTFLDGGSFPYGLKEPAIGLTSRNIRNFLSMDLHIHIGSHDVKVTSSLNQSDGAMRQGPNRFKRAINFYQSVSTMTEQNNLDFNWSYKEIRGVDHSNRKMAPSAAAVLID